MKPLLALSIRQPFAAQIMRGKKLCEYRSIATSIRARVYVYAIQRPRLDVDWKGVPKNPGRVALGVIIGTAEIVGCRQLGDREYEWLLSAPRRLPKPVAPRGHPNPVWFYPFGKGD